MAKVQQSSTQTGVPKSIARQGAAREK